METGRTISVEVRDTFSTEMERLRREYADQEWPGGTSGDEFDGCSSHVVVSIGSESAGMVRLTRRPPSVLAAQIDPHHLPDRPGIVEATRGVVARRWRGMNLYKLLMAEVTAYCDHTGASIVVAAIEPDFPLRDFLARIGYQTWGEPTRFRNHPKGDIWCHVIVQTPALARESVSIARSSCISGLHKRGFFVHSTVPGTDTPR